METPESLEQVQARHRRELRDLQGRITSKKKNASKKTRKGINDECAEMERRLKGVQMDELAKFRGDTTTTTTTTTTAQEELEPLEEGNADGVQNEEEQGALLASDNGDGVDGANGAQQQGVKKKKNRQKKRLARRAAEQESAIQRAHDEASQMTDHRARESEYMKRTFETHGLVEKDINPDGHCLFSAVADQLAQLSIPFAASDAQGPAYKVVRRAAAEYMLAHADDFAPFLEEDLADYAGKMRDTAEWGGQLELTALARCYGVEIRVIQDGRTERIGEGGERTLWLAYYRHGYGLGEHYNSLRRVATTTTENTTTTTSATTATTTVAAD